MAHEIRKNDKLVLNSGIAAWHGLGEVIDQALTPKEAVRRVLNWEPAPRPIFYNRTVTMGERLVAARQFLDAPTDDNWTAFLAASGVSKIDGNVANVRDDNEECLGVVTDTYKIVPNAALGDFAEALVGADKAVQIETCGSLMDGRRVFMLCKIPQAIRVGDGGADITQPYLILSNTHDGTSSLFGMWTGIRVVCNNTLGFAMGANFESAEQAADMGRGFRFRHTGDVMEKIEEARKALRIAVTMTETFQRHAEQLAKKQMTQAEVDAYFKACYIAIYGERPAAKADEVPASVVAAQDQWDARLVERRAEWTTLFDDEKQKLAGIQGTAWAALQAVTEWHDHKRSGGRVTGDRRKHSNLFGTSARDKRGAFVAAVASLRGPAATAV